MSARQISIAVDAMGGDNSPYKILKGTEIFCNNYKNTKIIFFGNKNHINEIIHENKLQLHNYEIMDTYDDVQDSDSASTILRSRKNSSIYQGLQYVKNTNDSGFVSAGNTAAIMILSRFLLGMIPGIDRPAICSVVPNKKKFTLMLDLGANVSVNASNILQFALMGYSYFSIIDSNKEPNIGIMNIGTEDNKGLEFLQEAGELISKSFLKNNYVGFIEPNKITSGECDIIVCDGYSGNIMLKTAEGLSEFITSNLKEVFSKSIYNKIAFKIVEKDLKNFRDQINPDKYNGATLIGLNGISVKSHGNASSYSFSFALKKCYDFIINDLNRKIINSFSDL
tara:strand:+ start:12016 stop:13029 length:1014 start_codon:yes stop_codon:yes gene_type:complete